MSRFCTECVSAPDDEIIDAGFRDRRGAVERDAAGGFDDEAARHHGHGLAHGREIEIVDQHHVGEADVEHLLELIERVDLDLDLDQMPGRRLGARQHRADAARDRDVVVLDQHRVVEAEAVIEAAAAADGVFLQRAQPGVVLRVQMMRALVWAMRAHEGRGRGGDAGEVAEEIERGALGGQDRARIAGDRHQLGPGLHRRAIACMRFDPDFRREPAKRRRDQRQAGDHAGLARDDDGAAAGVLRYGRDRGDVAGAAEVFLERARHRRFDFERRDEGVGAKKRHRHSLQTRRWLRKLISSVADRGKPTLRGQRASHARMDRSDQDRFVWAAGADRSMVRRLFATAPRLTGAAMTTSENRLNPSQSGAAAGGMVALGARRRW